MYINIYIIYIYIYIHTRGNDVTRSTGFRLLTPTRLFRKLRTMM